MRPQPSRRDVLRTGMLAGGVVFLGTAGSLVETLLGQDACEGPKGDLLGLLPVHGARAFPTPYGRIIGNPGLDARQFTDLSRISPDRLTTPLSEMFVRTTAPALDERLAAGKIACHGLRSGAEMLDVSDLRRRARPMGTHLIECAGNADPDNFGLMSVVAWDGVPLVEVLPALGSTEGAAGVLLSGHDAHSVPSQTSNPGASWVLPLPSVAATGAFLAVGIDGNALPPDHGAPVRLCVPGWYGCSWIKWVNEIRLVDADAPATTQMMEFSRRTHQADLAALARDYQAPSIDLAATPIRVEKRRVDGRLEYRVVGIAWGGDQRVDRLLIRFRAGGQDFPITVCPGPGAPRTWSLWDYRWRPTDPGVYDIALKAADPAIRTRRLDISYYVRRVIIDEV